MVSLSSFFNSRFSNHIISEDLLNIGVAESSTNLKPLLYLITFSIISFDFLSTVVGLRRPGLTVHLRHLN